MYFRRNDSASRAWVFFVLLESPAWARQQHAQNFLDQNILNNSILQVTQSIYGSSIVTCHV